jgi:HemY protein
VRAARDPAWTADGMVSDRWMPVSPVSGRLDAFEWRVPLAELAQRASIVEEERPDARLIEAPPAAPAGHAAAGAEQPSPPRAAATAPAAVATEAAGAPGRRPEPAQTGAPPEKIIPLVHAPDDPGPEADPIPAEEAVAEAPKRRFPLSFR